MKSVRKYLFTFNVLQIMNNLKKTKKKTEEGFSGFEKEHKEIFLKKILRMALPFLHVMCFYLFIVI